MRLEDEADGQQRQAGRRVWSAEGQERERWERWERAEECKKGGSVVVVVVVQQARRVCNQPLAATNVESYLVKSLLFAPERKVCGRGRGFPLPARKKHMLLMMQQKFLRDRHIFPRLGKCVSRPGNFLGQF